MERQITVKNECIDFLITQLDRMESDSVIILDSMNELEHKMSDLAV